MTKKINTRKRILALVGCVLCLGSCVSMILSANAAYDPNSKGYFDNAEVYANVYVQTADGLFAQEIELTDEVEIQSSSNGGLNPYKGIALTQIYAYVESFTFVQKVWVTFKIINSTPIYQPQQIYMYMGASYNAPDREYIVNYTTTTISAIDQTNSYVGENRNGFVQIFMRGQNTYATKRITWTFGVNNLASMNDYDTALKNWLLEGYIIYDEGKFGFSQNFATSDNLNTSQITMIQNKAIYDYKDSTEYKNAIQQAYQQGKDEVSDYDVNIKSTFSAISSVPLQVIGGLLNHDIFGINIFAIFGGILAISLAIFVIKLILGYMK